MRAAILNSPASIESRPLRIVDMEMPAVNSGEILLRVAACGICRTDLHVSEGDLEPRLSPITPGHQVVGVVEDVGEGVTNVSVGERVGAAWLYSTCGKCTYCVSHRENLCDSAQFTGWTRNGGFANYMIASADFVYPLPDGFTDLECAPLLCAGIIGYRALRSTGINDWKGARLGIYGFGAAGHVAIQIAIARGAEVYVATRDRSRHQALAEELGAAWIGDTFSTPPSKLDAAIIFAPAGEIVPVALAALNKGSALVLGGIHMSPIPELPYRMIYGERSIRSVANNTREDGREFLSEAAAIPVRTRVTTFDLANANDALFALKNDAIKGAGVLVP